MSRKKILFISEVYPSASSGTTLVTRNLIKSLVSDSSKYQVDLCCISFRSLVENRINDDNIRVFSLKKSGFRKLRFGLIFRLFEMFFSLKPVLVQRMYDSELNSLIKTLVKTQGYDMVFYHGFSTLQYYRSNKIKSIYIDDEDIPRLMYQRSKRSKSFFKKIYFFTEYFRSNFYQKYYFRKFKKINEIWAINKENKKKYKSISGSKVFVYPVIVQKKENVFLKKSKDIIFSGSLSWEENVVGLNWFLDEHWEKILKILPETKLRITGQQLNGKLKNKIEQHKNVFYEGFIANLADIYRESALAISPMLTNVGIKIKVLTYLNFGLPVVATKESTKGLAGKGGVVVAREDDFSNKVISILENDKYRQKLSNQANININNNYLSNQLIKFLVNRKIIK